MSYRGRPSKGCDACRARKIKCDETRPKCNKCIKSNYECTYRDQSTLLFRNQTAIAAQRAEDAWRKRATKPHFNPDSEKRKTHPDSDASLDLSTVDFGTLSLVEEVTPDVRKVAYERWVYDFVLSETPATDPRDGSSALLDFVPEIYENAAENSCVKSSVRAVAFANYCWRYKNPEAQHWARKHAGKTLAILQQSIADGRKAASDETLLTVYLMGMYENISTARHDGVYLAHKEGANALLQLRSTKDFYQNPRTARLFEMSYVQMLIGNIQSAKPPTLPLMNFANPEGSAASNSGIRIASGAYLIKLVHATTSFHASWHTRKHSSSPPSAREDLQGILLDAMKLNNELPIWESLLPDAFLYQAAPNTPEVRKTYDKLWQDLLLDGKGAPDEVHSYSALRRAWAWMLYRTTHMFLLRDMLEILNWMLRLPEPELHILQLQDHSISLDTVTLQSHHMMTTGSLVDVLQKACSGVIGHFTVPIPCKPDKGVVGMRGYTVFWALGVMDAILRMGLIPDTGSLQPPVSISSRSPSPFQCGAISPSYFNFPTESGFELPLGTDYSYDELSVLVSPFDLQSFPTTLPKTSMTESPLAQQSTSLSLSNVTMPDQSDKFMSQASVTSQSTSTTEILRQDSVGLDVKARREWIANVLCFVGNELGIRKALAVLPYGAQYIPSGKQNMESTYGKYPSEIGSEGDGGGAAVLN